MRRKFEPVLKEDYVLETKDDPDPPEGTVAKEKFELVLNHVLETKEDPDPPEGTVAKEKFELVLKKD